MRDYGKYFLIFLVAISGAFTVLGLFFLITPVGKVDVTDVYNETIDSANITVVKIDRVLNGSTLTPYCVSSTCVLSHTDTLYFAEPVDIRVGDQLFVYRISLLCGVVAVAGGVVFFTGLTILTYNPRKREPSG